MISFGRQAVVGQIGATHMRFAIIDIDQLKVDHFVSLRSAGFETIETAISAYLASVPQAPDLMCLAVSGPVRNGEVVMTNRSFRVSGKELCETLGMKRVSVVNDFEAIAVSLPVLSAHDLDDIGGGTVDIDGTKIVSGPGTGLGVASLVRIDGVWTALPSEGGHVSFAAETEAEFWLRSRVAARIGYVGAEHLLSGPGMSLVYAILAQEAGRQQVDLSPSEIIALADGESDPVACQVLGYFVTWLGRFMGDLALAHGATGGVYIGGGIAPHILPFLHDGRFRSAFDAKGVMSDYVRNIPVKVIKARDAGLKGAAMLLADRL
ncbi:glucokinase [Rhizobium alvei]|uniref:Glucokinase n=1 Tax=Rhizobium alvei TaxID=1132659 RepID=A0ABT8YI49_9HYPH|nr:glucokinase [Rhizobium alvei]MDO6963342.1 glucokinase [Rhizobium alvei]